MRELIALGTSFDHDPDGELSLTREGGHHRDRIAHAGGDATGAEIQRALIAAVERAPEIEVIEHALAVDLLLAADGGVAGRHPARDRRGPARRRRRRALPGGRARHRRPRPGLLPDHQPRGLDRRRHGASRCGPGATLRDLEFVQFHPTVMYLGPDSQGQQPLISEAVRGEGAFLVDFEGDRFMQGVHELADLAPRDVVAKAITRRMHETGHPHMWLDARAPRRARSGSAGSRPSWRPAATHGVDPVTELIPVAPACHYASGGVAHRPVGPRRRPGPLRHRRGRLLRRARRQPARLQLAARGPGVLPPDRRRAARRAAPAGPTRPPTRRTPGLVPGERPPRAAGA